MVFCSIINSCPIRSNEKTHLTKAGAKVLKQFVQRVMQFYVLVWFRDHNAGKIKTRFFHESKKSHEASA